MSIRYWVLLAISLSNLVANEAQLPTPRLPPFRAVPPMEIVSRADTVITGQVRTITTLQEQLSATAFGFSAPAHLLRIEVEVDKLLSGEPLETGDRITFYSYSWPSGSKVTNSSPDSPGAPDFFYVGSQGIFLLNEMESYYRPVFDFISCHIPAIVSRSSSADLDSSKPIYYRITQLLLADVEPVHPTSMYSQYRERLRNAILSAGRQTVAQLAPSILSKSDASVNQLLCNLLSESGVFGMTGCFDGVDGEGRIQVAERLRYDPSTRQNWKLKGHVSAETELRGAASSGVLTDWIQRSSVKFSTSQAELGKMLTWHPNPLVRRRACQWIISRRIELDWQTNCGAISEASQ